MQEQLKQCLLGEAGPELESQREEEAKIKEQKRMDSFESLDPAVLRPHPPLPFPGFGWLSGLE